MKKIIRSEGAFSAPEVERLRNETSAFLVLARIPGPQAYSIVTVVDEVACNILEHAKASFLEMELRAGLDRVELVFRDDGVAFDPTEKVVKQAALLPVDAEERRLGLYMVASLNEGLRYERAAGLNELSVVVPVTDPEAGKGMTLESLPGKDGAPWRVTLAGKVDVFSFTRLKKLLEQIHGDTPGAKVVVDLGKVTYIASSGWSVLLARRRLARNHGGDLVLCAMAPEIGRVYEAMKIAALLPLADDFEAAARLLAEAKP